MTETDLQQPDLGSRCGADGGMDHAIRISTAGVVVVVAGIAAYISYWHAYTVVREYGESGVTAMLEPATIDGLVYASSMVMLYAARHHLPVPRLARWMLALGILASLAVNVAQGWSHGLVGAVVAAWPAVALVGSYELLAWLIRTAATGEPDRVPAADHLWFIPDHAETGSRSEPGPVPDAGPADRYGQVIGLAPVVGDKPIPQDHAPHSPTSVDRTVPDHPNQVVDHPDQVDQSPAGPHGGQRETDAAAVAAYRASLEAGTTLSERKLAGMFGKTSRRWARSRMAEARRSPGLPIPA